MTAAEGRQFGRYRVTATLGRGAMGEVFAAVDDVLGRDVAIKTLRGTTGELGARILDQRFKHEARAIASLAHPGVVQVFDLDVEASPPYLVMERVMGPSLAVRLESGPLALDEVRALGVQIARALAAAHDQGIIHRDVKPGNILAAGGGRWKLADFGVAHVPDSSLTLTGQFIGSPAYAAPEALTKGELGAPADVYGLGAVLYQAASGRWPRADETTPGIAALLAPPPPLRNYAPDVPPALAWAIERALAPDPTKRPTADELARAIAEGTALPAAAPAGASGGAVPAGAPITTTPPPPVLDRAALERAATATPIPGPVAVSATATVPPTRYHATTHAAHAAHPASSRTKWILIAIGAALLIGILIGVSQRGGGTSASAQQIPITPTGLPGSDLADDGTITATPPAGLTGKSAKDWNKIVDKLYRGEFGEARDKLAEFERKYGRTPETADLAAQLDQRGFTSGDDEDGFGFGGPPGPPGRRGKHHD